MHTRLIAGIGLGVAVISVAAIGVTAIGVTALTSTQASAQQLYRWVDKNGKINYTQDPPPRDAAKSVQQRRLNSNAPPEGSQQIPFAVKQAMENFPVTLHTSTDCSQGCNEARALLNKRGVPFREISVSDEASFAVLKKMTGDTRVPVMQVGRLSEKGFEEIAYHGALDSAGYPRSSVFTGNPPALPSPKPQAKPAVPISTETPPQTVNSPPGTPATQAVAPNAN